MVEVAKEVEVAREVRETKQNEMEMKAKKNHIKGVHERCEILCVHWYIILRVSPITLIFQHRNYIITIEGSHPRLKYISLCTTRRM